MKKSYVIVSKKGLLTIPLWLRKNCNIEDRAVFRVVEKERGY